MVAAEETLEQLSEETVRDADSWEVGVRRAHARDMGLLRADTASRSKTGD